MNTLSYSVPCTPKPIPFLKIINNRIVSISRSIGILKFELEKKHKDKKSLLKTSLNLQKCKFIAEGRVSVIPRGRSSKSPTRISTTVESGHIKKSTLSPENMIAAMSREDRLALISAIKGIN